MTSRQPGAPRPPRRRPRLRPVLVVVTSAACGAAAALVAVDAASPSSSGRPVSAGQRNLPIDSYEPAPKRKSSDPWAPRRKRAEGARLPAQEPASPGAGPGCTVSRLLVPSCGAWWGAAFTTFPQATALRTFEQKIGRPLSIYHNYYKGRSVFPGRADIAIAREPGRKRLLLLNWKPDSGQSWAQVAAGSMDDHIDKLSAHFKKNFPERFWLAIHHEPENEVKDWPGSGYTGTDYRNMFRRVVQRFRRNGVSNAVFTMIYMAYSGYVVKPWFKQLYPGNDVVDWIGYDAYADPTVKTFGQLVDRAAPNEHRTGLEGFYRWARRNLSSAKPMMLGEWGGTELSKNPRDKAELFRSVARQARSYPAIKAFVYWDSPNGHKFGDTRIDASPGALQAYREVSRIPYFNPPVPAR